MLQVLTLNPQNPRRLPRPPILPKLAPRDPPETPTAMSAAARVFRGCRALMSPAAAGGKKPAAAQVTKAEAAVAKEKRGIMRPVPVSEALRRFAGGAPEISRGNATKLIWAHIKANGLQNPANKKEINCDEKLKTIFAGRDKVGMMEVAKLLSPHFLKTN